MVSMSSESHFSQSYGSFSSTLWLFMAFSNTDIRSCHRETTGVSIWQQERNAQRAHAKYANLIVRLGEIVQSQDMIQERAELRGKVFEHEMMVIRLF